MTKWILCVVLDVVPGLWCRCVFVCKYDIHPGRVVVLPRVGPLCGCLSLFVLRINTLTEDHVLLGTTRRRRTRPRFVRSSVCGWNSFQNTRSHVLKHVHPVWPPFHVVLVPFKPRTREHKSVVNFARFCSGGAQTASIFTSLARVSTPWVYSKRGSKVLAFSLWGLRCTYLSEML